MRSPADMSTREEGPHVFYLHGFASSARSTKAGWLAERLGPFGITLQCPDFNQPDFATLTMTRMLTQLEQAVSELPPGSVTLIGSSLGGTLAVLAAERLARVDRLVLLAPAVMFATPGHHLLPPARLDAWRRDGTARFFHYAYGEERLLNIDFYDDSLLYRPMEARVTQPTLIFQGRHDASVPYGLVETFARSRANVDLTLLDDDHSLVSSLPLIWERMVPFLGLT